MYDCQETSAAGAAFLDQYDPDWYQKIDLPTLDIGHGERCILGQLFGTYHKGLVTLSITGDDRYHLGFSRYIPGMFGELTHAWRDQVALRRLALITPEPVKELV